MTMTEYRLLRKFIDEILPNVSGAELDNWPRELRRMVLIRSYNTRGFQETVLYHALEELKHEFFRPFTRALDWLKRL